MLWIRCNSIVMKPSYACILDTLRVFSMWEQAYKERKANPDFKALDYHFMFPGNNFLRVLCSNLEHMTYLWALFLNLTFECYNSFCGFFGGIFICIQISEIVIWRFLKVFFKQVFVLVLIFCLWHKNNLCPASQEILSP